VLVDEAYAANSTVPAFADEYYSNNTNNAANDNPPLTPPDAANSSTAPAATQSAAGAAVASNSSQSRRSSSSSASRANTVVHMYTLPHTCVLPLEYRVYSSFYQFQPYPYTNPLQLRSPHTYKAVDQHRQQSIQKARKQSAQLLAQSGPAVFTGLPQIDNITANNNFANLLAQQQLFDPKSSLNSWTNYQNSYSSPSSGRATSTNNTTNSATNTATQDNSTDPYDSGDLPSAATL
jgi:hypothetical protein